MSIIHQQQEIMLLLECSESLQGALAVENHRRIRCILREANTDTALVSREGQEPGIAISAANTTKGSMSRNIECP
jgi:hypothetical protein